MRVYADRAFLPAETPHVQLLYPFWGVPDLGSADALPGRFDRYLDAASQFFELTTLEEADVALFPADWEHTVRHPDGRRLAEELAALAARSGRVMLVFYWSDSSEAVPIGNTVVFRTSLFRSQRRPEERAMPAWSEDLLDRYFDNVLIVREKRSTPVVSFCGYAPGLESDARLSFRGLRRGASHAWARLESVLSGTADASVRRAALRHLERAPDVETRFILRDRFWAAADADGARDADRMARERAEYVANIADSDYVLCLRGAGNFSYRLYEALSLGRIPIFVDTDCVLPFEGEIDWHGLTVWVDESQIAAIGGILAEEHRRMSPAEFRMRQERCRRIWKEQLTPEAFFAALSTRPEVIGRASE